MSKLKVSKERHVLVSWLTLSYLLNLCLLTFQMVGLMHYMYMCQRWCIYLVILDAFCLFKWIVSSLPKMVGHKGSSCWVLYSRIFTIKSFVIFFWVLPQKPRSKGILLKIVGGRSLEIMFLLFITPTLYTILAFSTGVHLYGGLNMISSERLIHSDMIIHVIFDFLDIIDIFHKFSIDYNSLINTFYFYKIFCGVFLATPIFLHGYSFPCMSGTSKAKTSKNFNTNSANDIYFCRKFAAIVGIFFVDLPFLFIRIYTWQSTVHYSAFAPFMLKNLCFLLLQIARIRHTTIGINSLQVNNNSSNTNNNTNNKQEELVVMAGDEYTDTSLIKKHTDDIKNVKIHEILLKMLLMINVDFKSELSHYLDTNLYFSTWFNILLSLPQFVFSLSKFILIILLFNITRHENMMYSLNLLDLSKIDKVFNSEDYKIFLHCFGILLITCCFVFLIWSILGPMLEALYLSVFMFIRLVSFVYSFVVVYCFIDVFKLLELISTTVVGKPSYYIFIIFAFKPFMNLLINLYPVLCVFLGKNYLYHINPSTFKHNKLKLHENLLFKKNIQDMTQYMVSDDEICVVNLSSFVLLINSKEMCSTYSSYSLLIGPNLIKASRLHYGLFSFHKKKLFTTFMVRCFCLLLTILKGYNYILLLIIFGIDILLMCFYILYSCIQRIIAMEAMELQIIANDILKEHNRDEFTKIMNYKTNDHITKDNKIYQKFKRHYQMTFPNTLFSLL